VASVAQSQLMQLKKKKESEGLVKSIVLAHVVLILHLCLLAALGVVVTFLSGVMQYMLWIVLGGLALMAICAYLLYRRLHRQGKSIGEALRSPEFAGRSVEISFLRGMATLRLDQPSPKTALTAGTPPPSLQLHDPETAHMREMNELANLLQKELITPEAFAMAKQRLLGRE
jgi:hypothetical protein